MEWQTLEHGIELATLDGIPLLVIVPTVEQDGYRESEISIELVNEAIEGETGWRLVTKTIAGWQDPRGWTLAVEWVGKLAEQMTYAEWKEVPRDLYARGGDVVPLCECTGLQAYSASCQLIADWRGQPAGAWAVWVSSGMCGFVRKVGLERVAMALAQEVRP